MAINIEAELDKIQKVSQKINSVGITIDNSTNISAAIKAAHIVVTDAFVKHMTKTSITNPTAFSHMYEWNRLGDPNSRLWRHVLQGGGKLRKSRFEFKASKTVVPVDPKLKAVGVEQRHIFYWKAPVMEYGLPVRISRKVAKALVYLHQKVKNPGSSSFEGFVRNGIVYRKSPVIISRAGNKNIWFSFTNEYVRWFNGGSPGQAVEIGLSKKLKDSISKTVKNDIKLVNKRGRSKSIQIDPMAYDPTIGRKLKEAMNKEYALASRNRVVE